MNIFVKGLQFFPATLKPIIMRTRLLVMLAFLFAGTALSGQKLIGLYGGANASWMYFGKAEYESNIFGYTIAPKTSSIWRFGGDWGVMGQLVVYDDLLAKGGIGFSRRGFDDKYVDEGISYDLRVGLMYVDVPVMIHWYSRLVTSKHHFVTVGGGVQFSLLAGNSVKNRTEGREWLPANHVEAFRNFDVSAVVNTSLQLKDIFFEVYGGLSFFPPMQELKGAFPIFIQVRAGYFIYGD